MKQKKISAVFSYLFNDEEDPKEIGYDPSHLGATIIVSLIGLGALYWLLWTLLVFEGGIFRKISAAASVLFTAKTLADVGYVGSPYQMGELEGWVGNAAALVLTAALIYAAGHAYRDAASKQSRRK